MIFCVKKREEIIRRLLILVIYVGALYKIFTWPQTHYLFDAIIEGKMDLNPMWSFLVLSLPLGSFTRELIGYLCRAIAELHEDRI